MSSEEASCRTNILLLLIEDRCQLREGLVVMIVLNLFGIFGSPSTGYDIFQQAFDITELCLIVKGDVDRGCRWYGAVQGLQSMLKREPAIREPKKLFGRSHMRGLAPDKK